MVFKMFTPSRPYLFIKTSLNAVSGLRGVRFLMLKPAGRAKEV